MGKDFFIDTRQLKSFRITLGGIEKQIPAATVAALNRTVDHSYTQIGREVSAVYAISQSNVKKTLRKHKANRGNLNAFITSTGHTLSMANFPFSPKKAGTKRAVTAKIKKADGIKKINTNPNVFVAPTGASSPDSVQYNVFRRIGRKRLPITVIRTLSVPQMIGNEGIMSKIQAAVANKLNERIRHEIDWRLNNAVGGGRS